MKTTTIKKLMLNRRDRFFAISVSVSYVLTENDGVKLEISAKWTRVFSLRNDILIFSHYLCIRIRIGIGVRKKFEAFI